MFSFHKNSGILLNDAITRMGSVVAYNFMASTWHESDEGFKTFLATNIIGV